MRRSILFFGILILLLFGSCKQLNKASDLISNPSAKEQYQRDYNVSNELFRLWEDQVDVALRDSIFISLPYLEEGKFQPRSFPVYSYNIPLNPGEELEVQVETDSINKLVFIELYRSREDSLNTFEKIKSSDFDRSSLKKEIEVAGTYKVVIQPEINANTGFNIKIKTTPVYTFPVAGGNNRSIQSLWGAARDGGRRNHEGIDIFAARGTPVVAATDGRITSSGEKGLGGKQVWLRDTKRGQSLYYAHLDSIEPLGNIKVKRGDTLGYVGNTGNARTTPPHLHFGIYKGYRGAINPLYHVFQLDEPNFEPVGNVPETNVLVAKSTANIRNRPATGKSQILGQLSPNDTIQFLGKTNDWFHVRTSRNKAAFVHESLVAPI